MHTIYKVNGFWFVNVLGLRIWPKAEDQCSIYAKLDYIRNTH